SSTNALSAFTMSLIALTSCIIVATSLCGPLLFWPPSASKPKAARLYSQRAAAQALEAQIWLEVARRAVQR
ncbi:MAG: hypothetical protein MUC50_07090, partial [Myxococcota bacterium]|nr:hypothetical protein [Myxococcota bacterium]